MTGELRPTTAPPPHTITGGHTQGTITTGDFSFDQPTLEAMIKEWLSLADDYDRSFRDSQRLTLVKGPGLDYASDGVAAAANTYGEVYLNYLLGNRDYCLNQAQLCQNALDDYLGVERRNVTDMRNSGRSENGSSGQGI